DDEDDDPPTRLNQGKKTKRRRTKESKSSKKPFTTKETPKGKTPSKGSKTGKSASAKELVKEPIAEVVMDDAGEDVVRDDDQPQYISEPKTAKTPNPDWFKKPLRPPTPDPESNKRQVVLGPAYDLLKGTCTSSIKLEYNFQECFNALTNKLDWNNPEGDRYPFDWSKPLPLQGRPGHLTVAADYFFNNDLEYLKSSDPERTYTTSTTKTKAYRYEIVGIEDMVPMLWSTIKHAYDKDATKGIKHWGEKRKLWYRSQMNKFSKHNVYSTQKILGVKSVSVKKLHGYGHLEEVMLGVENYQKKLNITPPQQTFPEIEFKELYTPSYKPPGVIYEDLVKQKRVMRADELYKFLDGTLKKVRDELHHIILDFSLGYNDEMSRRKLTTIDKKRSELMAELIDKQVRERRIIRMDRLAW
ncbi:hypothetical protein Tco_0519172, partial [Tanacetum coccineum]